jgi:PPOX class probable F420-dependent enzyme
VGHLACSTKGGKPLVVPICFTLDGSTIYSAIDEKPKRREPLALRRVSNIIQNPNVSLIVDEYSEDWRRLQYVLVDGTAAVLTRGRQFDAAISLLRKKYRQYNRMKLEVRPIIEIKPIRIVAWKARDARALRNAQTKRI